MLTNPIIGRGQARRASKTVMSGREANPAIARRRYKPR